MSQPLLLGPGTPEIRASRLADFVHASLVFLEAQRLNELSMETATWQQFMAWLSFAIEEFDAFDREHFERAHIKIISRIDSTPLDDRDYCLYVAQVAQACFRRYSVFGSYVALEVVRFAMQECAGCERRAKRRPNSAVYWSINSRTLAWLIRRSWTGWEGFPAVTATQLERDLIDCNGVPVRLWLMERDRQDQVSLGYVPVT